MRRLQAAVGDISFGRLTVSLVALLIVAITLPACTPSGPSRIKLPADASGSLSAPAPESPSPEAQSPAPSSEPMPATPTATPDSSRLWLALEPEVVTGGGEVRVTGGGFAASESIALSILGPDDAAPASVGEGTANEQGAFLVSIHLQSGSKAGTWTLKAVGQQSRAEAIVDLYVKVSRLELNLESVAVRQGEKLTVSAVGFDPGDSLSLWIQGLSAKPLLEGAADRAGNLDATEVQLPVLRPGDYTLVLRNKTGQRQATKVLSVIQRQPWVILDPYALLPGQSLSFNGYDFVPGEKVTVLLDGNSLKPLSKLTATDTGLVSQVAVYAPDAKATGRHTLTLVGEHSQQPISVQFEVLARNPSFGLSTYAGPAGTRVSFEGKGFEPNETIRVLLGDEQQEAARFTADGDGAFRKAGEISIPYTSQGGRLTVTLVGDNSQTPVTQEFNLLALQPTAQLSVYSGDRRTAIYVDGHGFAPDEEVGLYLGDQSEPIATAQADANGAVGRLGPVDIPAGTPPGTLTFVLKGAQSGAQANVSFTLSEASPQPSSANDPAR